MGTPPISISERRFLIQTVHPQIDPREDLSVPDSARVVASFDWFTVTGSGGSEMAKRVLRHWCGDLREMSGGEGYRTRFMSDDKAVFFDGNIANDECWKVSVPGVVCAKLDESIKGPICEWLDMGASLSRVDACVDLYCHETVPKLKSIFEHLNASGWLKRSGDSVRGRGMNCGWTEYVGSRKSERFVRVYDKGAKEHAEPNCWLRYEAVIKGRQARAVARELKPDADWAVLARGLAAGVMPELESLAPSVHHLLFGGHLSPLTVETRLKSLQGFLRNAERQVFKPLSLMAQTERMTILELIPLLGLDQVKPSERQSSHSPLLTDLRSLLDETCSESKQL